MKKINLRDYYPFYTNDTTVEVPDEVAALLREYKLAEAGRSPVNPTSKIA